MHKADRLLIFSFVATAFVVVVMVAVLNYIIDPLSYFRLPVLYPPQYSSNQRYQNSSLIHQHDYDSVFLGSSLTENFRASYMNQVLGGEWIRLSISGGTAAEFGYTLNCALKAKKTKRCMIDMYWWAYGRTNSMALRTKHGNFPKELYRKNIFDSAQYMLNMDNTLTSIDYAYRIILGHKFPVTDIDTINSWDETSQCGADAVWNFYEKNKYLRFNHAGACSVDQMTNNFMKTIGVEINENPDVMFDLVFFPVTPLYFILMGDILPNYFEFRRLVIDDCSLMPNVVVHDFSTQRAMVSCLNDYRDTHHFRRSVSDAIIRDVFSGSCIVKSGSSAQRRIAIADQIALFEQEHASKLGDD
ncbi:MAG: hypothetical protein PHP44_02785 [Kiritimatiellae bacterium]|nr:hypothetical protein [Kiritimatiellia bacterium]